jgi:Ca2+-transporting ATPase
LAVLTHSSNLNKLSRSSSFYENFEIVGRIAEILDFGKGEESMVKYGNMSELLPWHHMSSQDVLLALETSASGLPQVEVQERQLRHGLNELQEDDGVSLGRIFFRQLSNPLVFVLGIAVLLSVGLGRFTEGLLTFAVMLMNALMGVLQEYRAERALQALKKFLPAEVSVRRSGQVVTVSATQIVPGDILLLATGSLVPADARVIVAKDVSANESALTGESAEVVKHASGVAVNAQLTEQSSMLFAGSMVVSGRVEAVVVAIGRATQFGKVTEMVAGVADEPTPLQAELSKLSRTLVFMMVTAAVFVFAIGLARAIPVVEIVSTAAALAVAAVPEGLLVSVTVILTVGMRRMLKRQALVRKLVAAETLGGVNVLCIDKTGTLTTGAMELVELRALTRKLSMTHFDAEGRDFLRDLRLVNSARIERHAGGEVELIGSVTEKSILRFVLAQEANVVTEGFTVTDELPFASSQKYAAVTVREPAGQRMLVLGAPDVLLEFCDLNDHELQTYHSVLEDMATRGLRVLLLANKTWQSQDVLSPGIVRDLQPIGLVGLRDPLRVSALDTLTEARNAGVRVIMITGDHPVTASAVARELDLPTDPRALLLGSELADMSDEILLTRLRTVAVCARILPEQKLRIVRGLQRLGATVAMTGDGVNDTPALRAADIGVAVGSGTEAAKESADMVILDDDVQSIVAAIREGRVIFDNIRKVLTHLLTFSMSELVFIAAVIVIGLPVPLWPLHILWINLVTDGLPSLALAFEPAEPRIMQEPPRARHTPLLSEPMRRLMVFVGILAVSSLIAIFVLFSNAGLPIATLRTLLFVSLGLDSLTAIFPLRSLRQPFWRVKLFRNPELIGAFLIGLFMLFLPIFTPGLRIIFDFSLPSLREWGLVFGLMFLKLLLIEVAKWWFLEDIRKENGVLVS